MLPFQRIFINITFLIPEQTQCQQDYILVCIKLKNQGQAASFSKSVPKLPGTNRIRVCRINLAQHLTTINILETGYPQDHCARIFCHSKQCLQATEAMNILFLPSLSHSTRTDQHLLCAWCPRWRAKRSTEGPWRK